MSSENGVWLLYPKGIMVLLTAVIVLRLYELDVSYVVILVPETADFVSVLKVTSLVGWIRQPV